MRNTTHGWSGLDHLILLLARLTIYVSHPVLLDCSGFTAFSNCSSDLLSTVVSYSIYINAQNLKNEFILYRVFCLKRFYICTVGAKVRALIQTIVSIRSFGFSLATKSILNGAIWEKTLHLGWITKETTLMSPQ